VDGLEVFQAPEAATLAPVQKPPDGVVVGGAGVFVADGNGEEFKEVFGRLRASSGDEGRGGKAFHRPEGKGAISVQGVTSNHKGDFFLGVTIVPLLQRLPLRQRHA
jgi:hypothetical protein